MAGVKVDALRDDQCECLRDLVPGGRESQRGPRCDNRRRLVLGSGVVVGTVARG